MEAKEILKKINAKSTVQRIRVLEIIMEFNEPVTADQIYELYYDADLSTIYRILLFLTDKKILNKTVRNDGKAYYNLVNSEQIHNHYIKCVKCGNKKEIESCPMHEFEYKLEDETGFKKIKHRFEFNGICPDCQKKK